MPSPQLRHVKEEPVGYDDQCFNDPLPLLQIESAPTPTEMAQTDADSYNDEQSSSSDKLISIKREIDEIDEEEEHELKRPKLMPPSPPITQVKEEPIESHDPLLELEGVSEESQLAQPAMSANSTDDQSDEDMQVNREGDAADDGYELERFQSDTDSTNDQLDESTLERLCATCEVEQVLTCFTKNELAKGDSAICVACDVIRLHESTIFQSIPTLQMTSKKKTQWYGLAPNVKQQKHLIVIGKALTSRNDVFPQALNQIRDVDVGRA